MAADTALSQKQEMGGNDGPVAAWWSWTQQRLKLRQGVLLIFALRDTIGLIFGEWLIFHVQQFTFIQVQKLTFIQLQSHFLKHHHKSVKSMVCCNSHTKCILLAAVLNWGLF